MAVPEGAEYRCFVGGLAWATDDRNLEAAFSPFGEILNAKIINDRETGRSRGFGFVTFSREQSMRDAIEGLNGKLLDGRSITVNEAHPRRSGGGGGCAGRRPGGGGGQRRSGGGGGNSDRRGSSFGISRPMGGGGFASPFDDCFASPFRQKNIFGFDDCFASPLRQKNIFADPFSGFDDIFAGPFANHGEASMHAPQRRPRKAAPIEYRLACNLADLYKGVTKKMKISREISDSTGGHTAVEEILTIDIKPGWKKGTKITFLEMGNESPHVIPADIVFVIDEKPHDQFTREGNDLVMTQKISFAEDWTRYTVQVTTLDGRNLTVPINSAVNPGYEEVVPGEGMPIRPDPSKKGNLRIKFSINAPSRAKR